MANKPKLVIFTNFYVGGVFSFFKNLLLSLDTSAFDVSIIYTYNEQPSFELNKHTIGLHNEHIYVYKKYGNVKKQYSDLKNLIGNNPSIIIVSCSEELEAIHYYNINARVIYFCYDDFYLANAYKYQFLIDHYLVQNPAYFEILNENLQVSSNKVTYIPYGVSATANTITNTIKDNCMEIVWLARMHELKGINEIPAINNLLLQKSIKVNWTMIGGGPELLNIKEAVSQNNNFTFYQPSTDEGVKNLLQNKNIFILPSYLDGLPVAMLECMSAGVVPVTYEFNKGIKKLFNNICATIVNLGDQQALANAISTYYFNETLLLKHSQAAINVINVDYNIANQAVKYNLFLSQQSLISLSNKALPSFWKLHGIKFHKLYPYFLLNYIRVIKNYLRIIKNKYY